MLKLPSGACVEKILFGAFCNTSHECLEHSFIIDISNPTTPFKSCGPTWHFKSLH